MRIRIKDIAEKAGVSTGTVDRVLHNRGNVSKKVKAHVEKVMEEIGYQRNFIASTLAYNRSLRIAALVFCKDDPYWRQIDLGVQKAKEATSHYGVSIDVFYCDLDNPEMFGELANEIINSCPDGVLVAPSFIRQARIFLTECKQNQLPVAMINSQVRDYLPLCYIGQDSYQSGVVAARLLHFGIKEQASALLLNLDTGSINAQHLLHKERGFRDYFHQVEGTMVNVITEYFEDYNSPKRLESWLISLLGSRDDWAGIFVTNSRAHLLIDVLDPKWLRDKIVVGFDLVEPNIAHLRENRIHYLINQNPTLQGYLGITNLVKHLLLNQEVAALQYLPLDIVVRENCNYYLGNNFTVPLSIF